VKCVYFIYFIYAKPTFTKLYTKAAQVKQSLVTSRLQCRSTLNKTLISVGNIIIPFTVQNKLYPSN